MRTKSIVLALLAALCVSGMAAALPAASAPPPAGESVSLQVQPFFEGSYKYGEWLPLRVSIGNNGADLSAELRAVVASGGINTTYAAPAPLPAGSHKEIILYVELPSFARNVTVDLVRGDEVLQSYRADVHAIRNITYVVGAIVPDAGPYSLIEGLALHDSTRTVKLAPFSLRDIPERAQALRSFDALVIADTDTLSLTPAQNEALSAWVASGGRLVLAGGPGAERTLAGLSADLKPTGTSRSTLARADRLQDYARLESGGLTDVEYAVAAPQGRFGNPLVTQDGFPLIAEKSYGQGWVTYLSFDPGLQPFAAWTGMRQVWENLFATGSAYPQNMPPDASPTQMASQRLSYALTNLPSLDLPSVRWLAILLGVYVLLVGPANYLALRRLRRLDWAWITIPALTLVFAGTAFGIGYRLRGSDVILNQITIVQKSDPGAPALARAYIGVFSPARSTYSFALDGDAMTGPMTTEPNRFGSAFEATNLTIVQGDRSQVRDLGINQWAMQSFQTERYVPAEDWNVEADLDLQDGRAQGTLRNRTAYDLKDTAILVGSRFALLGDLPAGGELKVDAELRGSSTTGASFPYALFEERLRKAGTAAPPRDVTLKQNILENLFNQDPSNIPGSAGLVVFGWFSDSPIKVARQDGAAGQQMTSLLLVGLPLDLKGNDVTLLPGILAPHLIDVQNGAGSCGNAGRVFVADGTATLEYSVPPGLLDATVTQLVLSVGQDGGQAANPPAAELYDWTARDWASLATIQVGNNTILEPARFVNPADGTVRLRLQGEDKQSGGCFLFDMGLQAKRGQA